SPQIRAALFDFGGVVLTSPFDAFATYESTQGLPAGFIRGLNATNPENNAWALLERSHVSPAEFCELFEAEARAAGGELSGRDVLALLSGEVRPQMVEAIRRCHERLKTACLTNNFVSFDEFPSEIRADGRDQALALFDVIVESSKVGIRKPDPAFYQ